jgi:hypothetical protein
MRSRESGVERVAWLARRAERRARASRAIGVLAVASNGALIVAIADIAARKVGLVGEPFARAALFFSGTSVLVAAIAAWFWRLPEYTGSRALDRFYGLHDRLTNALAFAALPTPERTPFMDAAIEDALAAARDVKPAPAVPIRLPSAFAVTLALAAACACVMAFEVRRHVPVVRAPTLVPLEVSADDLDDVREFLARFDGRAKTDEAKSAIEELNRLLTDVAERRLDRTEVFRRLEALDMKLAADVPPNPQSLEQGLSALGQELEKAELARAAGAALKSGELARARDAMQDLAKKVKAQAEPVDKAKLDALRDALRKAADAGRERRSGLEKRRQQLADEVDRLKQRTSDAGADEERSLLQKKEQELERLDRELGERGRDQAQLDRLDRELEQAAEDLAKDLGLGSQDLEQGAEDLNRMNEQQMSDEEKQELRQKLTELRELLRQQAAGGKGQMNRLRRFSRLARGQSGAGQGGGADNGGSEGGDDPSGGEQGGESKSGSSLKQEGGEVWMLGPHGEKVLMLSESQRLSAGSGGEPGGRPQGWGDGHDPKVQGAPTQAKMGTEDTEVQGAETGQGGSRSQTIFGASSRGFASKGYRKVFTEYHQVAEESLARDDVPSGYRFYVKRYFQLIRPREEPER